MEGWLIYDDGRVVDLEGTEKTISTQAVTDLLALADEAGFFGLAPSYMPSNTCCDLFTYEITIRQGGQLHTVSTMDTADFPPELERILGEIDAAVRSG